MPLSLAYPNRFSAATLSGVGWTAGLPLSFLATRQISQVARAITTRGRFYAAWPSAIEAGAIAMAGHNLTTAGTWRVRAFAQDPRPTLDLDFTLGQVPAGITCTRASSGTFWGSNGLLQTAGNNVARIQHDPATGQPLGLLVEADSGNGLSWARDLANAAWSKSSMTAALTATGIDGVANSASRLTAGTTARVTSTHAIGAPFVFSVYLRRVSGTGPVRLTINNFSTSTTVVPTSQWQRFEVVSLSANTIVGIALDTNGDVVEVDYAQVEPGSIATSPILTAGAAANRAGDDITASVTGVTLSGAAVLQGTLIRRPSSTRDVLRVANGSASATINITSGGVPTGEYVQGATQASISGAAISPGPIRVGFSYGLDDFRFASAGVAGTPDTSGTVSTAAATSVTIGATAGQLAMVVAGVRIYPSTRTAADLTSLTTAEFEHVASYDSGTVNAWPAEWVSGTTAEERAGVRGTAILSPASAPSSRWWRVDITDAANPAGYIEAGRFFFGSRWRPQYGALSGARIGYIDRATSVEADSGAEYFVERPTPRLVEFELVILDESIAMGEALEMQRQLGTTGEVLFQWDDNDTAFQPARCFLGRLRTMQPLTCLWRGHWRGAFEVKELL